MANLSSSLRRAPACLLAAALCAGCVGGGDPADRLPLLTPERVGLRAETTAADWPAAEWWRAFGDPQLNRLIERACADGPSIQIAEARVRLARQAEIFARTDTQPTVELNANANRQRYSEHYLYPPPLGGGTFTDGRVALDFAYEFDFWGRQRAALSAATRQVEVQRAEVESAKLVLAVAVAQTYVALQRSYAELAVAHNTARQRAAVARLYEIRASKGLSSRAVVEPQTAAAANAEQIATAEQQNIDVLKHQLAALTGQGPDALAELTEPKVDGPVMVPTALPVDLLARRPDIVAQRLRVEVAGQDILSAKAEFYPNIDLTAFFGFQALGMDNLLKGSSRTYGVGPALHLPIFNRSTLRANLGARYADYDLAVAQYNQTVLDAARDVADQGGALHALARQRAAADTGSAALQRAYDISQLRRRRGLANQLEVLDAEAALLAQQRTQAELRECELQAALSLIKALGGGYSTAAAAAPNASGEQQNVR